MKNKQTRREFGATALATVLASAMPAPFVWAAEKKYDPGASDTEIKLGQTVPHSGPGSLYGVLGRVGEAYFQMLNEKGGINGRKVKFLTMDDAYSAPKCVEATRRLVEQEEVLALYGSLGTAPQTAVHKYLNSKGVPQLLLNTGASKWNDPKNFKWTMAGLPLYPTEARILAKHVVGVKPNAKVGILYQNDDFGRDFLGPVQEGAGGCRRHRQGDHGADLRSDRADGRFAAHQSLEIRRGRFLQYLDRQGVVAVDPQGRGTRLEAAASALGGLDRPFDSHRRRPRERHRHRRDPLRQGSRRAALREGPGRDGVRGVAQEISAQCRS